MSPQSNKGVARLMVAALLAIFVVEIVTAMGLLAVGTMPQVLQARAAARRQTCNNQLTLYCGAHVDPESTMTEGSLPISAD